MIVHEYPERQLAVLAALWLVMACGSGAHPTSHAEGGAHASGAAGDNDSAGGGAKAGGAAAVSGAATNGGGGSDGVAGRGDPEALDPNDSPPKIGEAGCGFEKAAFCDTFGGAATASSRARGGELDGIFWSGSRSFNQLSTTRALGVGAAVIPECRPDVPAKVWVDQDALICEPTFDWQSKHLLAAAASQFYGQNGYRIRQPFDFAARTGKIVFDASTDPMSPLTGWISLAVTEDPISAPGYAIVGNDEGSIIPKNALEVHFANIGDDSRIGVRNLQVFQNHADTVYAPAYGTSAAARSQGKLNHFELSISEQQVAVSIWPYSQDGASFSAPPSVYTQAVKLPFNRGYVQLSLHNHATLKYTDQKAPGGLVDAAVARIDNVGFDGPVISNWREYSVPDSRVKFQGEPFQPVQDPHNPENVGYDIGFVVRDVAQGPGPALHLAALDLTNVESARLALTLNVTFTAGASKPSEYALRARLNGHAWHERKLTAEEVAFFGDGPTTVDSAGKPLGDPASQGRLALLLDIPTDELVAGQNDLELLTANVPTSYPPIAYNVDLVLRTR